MSARNAPDGAFRIRDFMLIVYTICIYIFFVFLLEICKIDYIMMLGVYINIKNCIYIGFRKT